MLAVSRFSTHPIGEALFFLVYFDFQSGIGLEVVAAVSITGVLASPFFFIGFLLGFMPFRLAHFSHGQHQLLWHESTTAKCSQVSME